jgi:hypothetical protein
MHDLLARRKPGPQVQWFSGWNGKLNLLGFPQDFPQHRVALNPLLSKQLTRFVSNGS